MEANGERIEIGGLTASAGMSIGDAVILPDFVESVPRKRIDASSVESELARFESAKESSMKQLEDLLNQTHLAEEHKEIFEAQQLIINDPMLVGETRKKVAESHMNVEWALAMVLDHLKEMLGAAKDPYFRERVADLEDIGNRIISNLMEIPYDDVRVPFIQSIPPKSILIAESISPSLMLQLGHDIGGIVTEKGGITGHMAILARDRGIPALVQVADITKSVADGDRIMLDGDDSRLIINPDEDDRIRYSFHKMQLTRYTLSEVESPVHTADGQAIHIWANLDSADDAMNMRLVGVTGVGLFRTEFLYLKNPKLLESVEEQTAIYSSILKFMRGKPVTFRLLDLGDDKPLHAPLYRYAGIATDSANLRGIRFLLANRYILKDQIKSIYTGALREEIIPDNCRIMVPMVTTIEEIREVKAVVEEVRAELAHTLGRHIAPYLLGIMLETPSACLMADTLSDEVDFFSFGTNDLAQYTLALRRTDNIKGINPFLEPALYRMIQEAVLRAKKPVSICGEVASIPEIVPLLIGLGIRNLSVSITGIQRTHHALVTCQSGSCGEIAERVLAARDSSEVAEILGFTK